MTEHSTRQLSCVSALCVLKKIDDHPYDSIRNIQRLFEHLRGFDNDYSITPLIYLAFTIYAYFSGKRFQSWFYEIILRWSYLRHFVLKPSKRISSGGSVADQSTLHNWHRVPLFRSCMDFWLETDVSLDLSNLVFILCNCSFDNPWVVVSNWRPLLLRRADSFINLASMVFHCATPCQAWLHQIRKKLQCERRTKGFYFLGGLKFFRKSSNK